MFNKNELILDKVRSLVAKDLTTSKMLFRLTSLEDPSLTCTSESEEVTDALGAVITTLYRAKRATFSATNSLISLDLAAAQYGTKKQVASSEDKIVDYTYEIITAKKGATTVDLKETPVENGVLWIYTIEDGEIGTAYKVGTAASATEFAIEGKKITLPTDVAKDADIKVYVEYNYETENAVKISNKASEFPEACSVVIYAYFKDRCNENLTYSGKIICNKAKLNPESIELALTSTGKHAFEFTMMKDYCADEGDDELFAIIISQ